MGAGSRHEDDVAIRASGLSKRYGATVALDGLNLAIGAGEVYGYLGPNGAGKTTTIRLVFGLQRPSEAARTCWLLTISPSHRVTQVPLVAVDRRGTGVMLGVAAVAAWGAVERFARRDLQTG